MLLFCALFSCETISQISDINSAPTICGCLASIRMYGRIAICKTQYLAGNWIEGFCFWYTMLSTARRSERNALMDSNSQSDFQGSSIAIAIPWSFAQKGWCPFCLGTYWKKSDFCDLLTDRVSKIRLKPFEVRQFWLSTDNLSKLRFIPVVFWHLPA